MLYQKYGKVVTPEAVIVGAFMAMLLVIVDSHLYHEIVHHQWGVLPPWLGSKSVNLHFVANELLMPLFFAIAAKEIREYLLPGGALYGIRRAGLPIVATAGGVLMPIAVFLALSTWLQPSVASGFVVPTATDIVFALLVAKLLIGDTKHPAVALLMTIAVVDDGIGLVLIPLVYSGGVDWLVFGLMLTGIVGAVLYMRLLQVRRFWWYLAIPGVLSWVTFAMMGIEPAMALVPVVLAMPYAKDDKGYDSPEEHGRSDALNKMDDALAPIIGTVLLLFGFANAGVSVSGDAWGTTTAIVLVALIVGKFVGVAGFAYVGLRLGMQLPNGMKLRELPVVAAIAGIGFTVAIFVAGVAFSGVTAEQAKMGAVLSLPVGLLVAYCTAKLMKVKKSS